MAERKWINFARYSSPPIGKGRMLEATMDAGDGESAPGIWIRMSYDDGHEYAGWLVRQVDEEEEE